MNRRLETELSIPGLNEMFAAIEGVLSEYAANALTLFNYASTPIKTDDDLIERADLMDMLMGMALKEDDIAMVYANAISAKIEEYERENRNTIKVCPVEMLKGLMEIKKIKQSDLSSIATQSVISEILHGKRKITLNHAKGFAAFFNLPLDTFID